MLTSEKKYLVRVLSGECCLRNSINSEFNKIQYLQDETGYHLPATLTGVPSPHRLLQGEPLTCSNTKQTPKCCQLLFSVDVLGRTVDIGVACAPCMQRIRFYIKSYLLTKHRQRGKLQMRKASGRASSGQIKPGTSMSQCSWAI